MNSLDECCINRREIVSVRRTEKEAFRWNREVGTKRQSTPQTRFNPSTGSVSPLNISVLKSFEIQFYSTNIYWAPIKYRILCQELMYRLPKCVKQCPVFAAYAQHKTWLLAKTIQRNGIFYFKTLWNFLIVDIFLLLSWEQHNNVWGEALTSSSLRMKWIIHRQR